MLSQKILPVIILILIYLYLKISMMRVSFESIGLEKEGGGATNVGIALVIFLIFYLILNKKPASIQIYNSSLNNSLIQFLVYVYVISFLVSLNIPFQTRNLYFVIAMPLFVYWVSKRYAFIQMKNESFLWGAGILFLLLLYQYILNYNEIHIVGSATASINTSYFILYMLPFILCIRNNKIKFILIALVFITVVSSFKRSGTISVSLALLVYYYVNYIRDSKPSSKAFSLLFLLSVFFVVVNYILISDNTTIGHLIERFSNISEDNGSGRSDAINSTVILIENSNVFSLFFGHGWNMVEQESSMRISAHNDFLECIYDFGLIGLILYLRLYLSIYKKYRELKSINSYYAAPVLVSGVILFSSSMFSHIIIYPFYMIQFVMFWGYINCLKYNNEI